MAAWGRTAESNTSELTLTARVHAAREAVHRHNDIVAAPTDPDSPAAISSLLADLMHLSMQHRVDFTDLLSEANARYCFEQLTFTH